MKKAKRFLAATLLLLTFFTSSIPVSADNTQLMLEKWQNEIILTGSMGNTIALMNINKYFKNGKSFKVTSTSKKVNADVIDLNGKNYLACSFNTKSDGSGIGLKSSGKIKITATVHGKKKTKTISVKCLGKKYTSPVKSFKIGTKQYKSKLKKTWSFGTNLTNAQYKKLNGKKLSIKPAKNWKIASIKLHGATSKDKIYEAVIKNNTKLKKLKYFEIEVLMKNKKTHAIERLYLSFRND